MFFFRPFFRSGAIAIEALSRGAESAVLVENNGKAVDCIRENLKTTKMEDRAMVMACDVITALSRLEGKGRQFDIVFMDPPYHHGLELEALKKLGESGMVSKDSIIITEASLETKYDDVETLGFRVSRVKEYKTNKHVFFTFEGEAAE
ncbi:RsmD family RNA methyltransferase [Clostridium sp. AM58-1XD]|uniref:RsmD family RNA methyltransferase n=1 Tax=Clostridium sp. AM58-1XD TaxID=2292307 RepID=UPI00325ACDBF